MARNPNRQNFGPSLQQRQEQSRRSRGLIPDTIQVEPLRDEDAFMWENIRRNLNRHLEGSTIVSPPWTIRDLATNLCVELPYSQNNSTRRNPGSEEVSNSDLRSLLKSPDATRRLDPSNYSHLLKTLPDRFKDKSGVTVFDSISDPCLESLGYTVKLPGSEDSYINLDRISPADRMYTSSKIPGRYYEEIIPEIKENFVRTGSLYCGSNYIWERPFFIKTTSSRLDLALQQSLSKRILPGLEYLPVRLALTPIEPGGCLFIGVTESNILTVLKKIPFEDGQRASSGWRKCLWSGYPTPHQDFEDWRGSIVIYGHVLPREGRANVIKTIADVSEKLITTSSKVTPIGYMTHQIIDRERKEARVALHISIPRVARIVEDQVSSFEVFKERITDLETSLTDMGEALTYFKSIAPLGSATSYILSRLINIHTKTQKRR